MWEMRCDDYLGPDKVKVKQQSECGRSNGLVSSVFMDGPRVLCGVWESLHTHDRVPVIHR